MKNYDVYLFDFDFTLADSGDGIAMCFQMVFKNHGLDGVSDDAIKKTIGLPLRECFTIITGVTDDAVLSAWCDEFHAYADKYMAENTPLFPHTEALLKRLKADGKKTGIISTKRRVSVEESLALCGISRYIDLLIAIEDVPFPKPDPTGILTAMKTLGGRKDNTLYTGDSTIDANAAKNAGLDFVAVTTGMTPAEDFSGLPYIKIITDIGQLL